MLTTIAILARRTGIARRTIQQAILDGKLPAQKLGRDWHVDEDDVAVKSFILEQTPRIGKRGPKPAKITQSDNSNDQTVVEQIVSSPTRSPRGGNMYKIAIAIQKGGTAKTTTSLCLAGALTLLGRKVLVIDLDPQANSTTSLAIEPDNLTTPTIFDVLSEPHTTLASSIISTGYGIDLVPASIKLALAEKQLLAATGREKKLHRKLIELERQTAQAPDLAYDYVLLDCPPSLGILTLNALAAATSVIVPLQCEHYAERGFGDFLDTLAEVKNEVNEDIELMGVLLTLYSATKTNRDVASHLREMLGDQVFETIISRRTILTDVPVKGPVQAYAPSSESAVEYNNLAKEVEAYVQR